MARPRSKADDTELIPGQPWRPSMIDRMAAAILELETAEPDTDVRKVVAQALATLATSIDTLNARLDEQAAGQVIYGTGTGEAPEHVEGGLVTRVTELEQRVHEAGRRLIWTADRRPGGLTPAPTYLADIGRAMLFDGEQPETEAQPQG